MFKRVLFSALLGVGLLAFDGVAAHADNNVNATVNAGSTLSLSGGTSAGFSATLTGLDQTVYGAMSPIVVTDNRGSGDGWHVDVQATQFSTTSPVHSLPASSLLLNAIDASAGTGSTATLPATVLGSTALLDTASPTRLASAGSGEGMGVVVLTSPAIAGHGSSNMDLAIPADAYAGSYTSTLTVSVTSGP